MAERYSRQERFAPIGKEGQALLAEKHVLIVGAGALGSANAEMLARAGIGRIRIIDRDYIEWSNLARQQLYTEEDAAGSRAKAKAAEARLKAINSTINVEGIAEEFDPENAELLLKDVDILIDGTDNFNTRFIINDAACKYKVPWIYGGCVKSDGISLSILPGQTPCLQCLIDQLPQDGETCETAGIIGPAVQVTAAYQTAECLKFLTGHSMSTHLVSFDVWGRQYSSIDVVKLKDPHCASCSDDAQFPYLKKEKGIRTAVLCGRNTVQVRPGRKENVNLERLAQRIEPFAGEARVNEVLLRFHMEEKRFVVFKDGRTLIHGVEDVQEAKKLYHRYVEA
ncbi:ThiF family adenylyltransferase [Thalassobacillus devorans]|uniref:ThiF family adenylyltransferase n=1 Tax=Thalassobacillus devorans TaxID=279813 RepID=UPI000A1C8113|nr:ThiF family adenylyltransferase [Thalassobacillus devorans]